jgi:hypothetical protein
MKKRNLIPAILVLLFGALLGDVSAQAVRTPEPNSPERKAILEALRVPVERDLKQKIVFVVDQFNISGNWAWVSGRPTQPDGSRPDLSKTAWNGDEDLFDDNFFGLLKKTGGKWRVVKHALGCTDVCYLDWPAKYKAPKRIFPFGS